MSSVGRLGALAWALSQRLPPVEKLALIEIANSGYVDVTRIATFSSIDLLEAADVVSRLIDHGLLTHQFEGLGVVYDDCLDPKAGSRQAAIPIAVRRSVYERDDYQCRHCGTKEDLSIDHIVPRVRGGSNEPENLQVLCLSCNGRKGTA